MQHVEKLEEFTKSLEDALSAGYSCNTASKSWNYVREAIQKSALASCGWKTSKNCDWFEAKSEKLTPVIVAKRAALAEYECSPSTQISQEQSTADSKKMCQRVLAGAH